MTTGRTRPRSANLLQISSAPLHHMYARLVLSPWREMTPYWRLQ